MYGSYTGLYLYKCPYPVVVLAVPGCDSVLRSLFVAIIYYIQYELLPKLASPIPTDMLTLSYEQYNW